MYMANPPHTAALPLRRAARHTYVPPVFDTYKPPAAYATASGHIPPLGPLLLCRRWQLPHSDNVSARHWGSRRMRPPTIIMTAQRPRPSASRAATHAPLQKALPPLLALLMLLAPTTAASHQPGARHPRQVCSYNESVPCSLVHSWLLSHIRPLSRRRTGSERRCPCQPPRRDRHTR